MQINFMQVLFQVINFGVILFVLNKYLYKPIMKMLDTRQAKINEGLAAADKNIKAAEAMEKEKKTAISKARKEAAAIIKAAEADAKLAGDSILATAKEKAKAEAERILKSAQAEQAQALKAVEAQASQLAVVMAKKALASTLSPKEVDAITAKLVAKLG